jgi:hypothetical protein
MIELLPPAVSLSSLHLAPLHQDISPWLHHHLQQGQQGLAEPVQNCGRQAGTEQLLGMPIAVRQTSISSTSLMLLLQ